MAVDRHHGRRDVPELGADHPVQRQFEMCTVPTFILPMPSADRTRDRQTQTGFGERQPLRWELTLASSADVAR
jgi:hypothetical protein